MGALAECRALGSAPTCVSVFAVAGRGQSCPILSLRKPKLKSRETRGCGAVTGTPAGTGRPPSDSCMRTSCSSVNPRFPPPDVSHVFPEFPAPDLGSVLLQESITLHDVKALQLVYRRHCEVTVPPPRTGDRRPGPRGGAP